jgi:tetratricopeptide (TPR) repeat protein
MPTKFRLITLALCLISIHAQAGLHEEAAKCRTELKKPIHALSLKESDSFSSKKGAECMDLFFLHPDLEDSVDSNNKPVAFKNGVALAEKILKQQPNNMKMYFTLSFLYQSQWRLSVEQPDKYSMYSNRLNDSLKLIRGAEPRFKTDSEYWNEKGRSLLHTAVLHRPDLVLEVISSFKRYDKMTSVVKEKMKTRYSVGRLYESVKDYDSAAGAYESVLSLDSRQEKNVAAKLKVLEEKRAALNKTAPALKSQSTTTENGVSSGAR